MDYTSPAIDAEEQQQLSSTFGEGAASVAAVFNVSSGLQKGRMFSKAKAAQREVAVQNFPQSSGLADAAESCLARGVDSNDVSTLAKEFSLVIASKVWDPGGGRWPLLRRHHTVYDNNVARNRMCNMVVDTKM